MASYKPRWEWDPGDYAIGITRVSTDETNQPSRTEQEDFVRAGADIIGLPVPENGYYYTELSRDVWPRPEVEEAFERMADPHCRAVIVWNTDRLYADPVQQAESWQALEECGVKLFDMYGHWENEPGEMPEAMAGLKAILARVEVRRTRRRVYETHYAKASHGIFVQKPPYGVRATGTRRQWVVDPDEVEVLTQMYQWAADGWGLAYIERGLADMGIVSTIKTVKKGKRTGRSYGGVAWSKSNIRKMLRNRFYRGEVVWNRYKTVRGRGGKKSRVMRPESEWISAPHALGPIVDVELWDRANEMIDRRSGTREKNRKYPEKVWDGFVYDGRCGWRMYPRKRANRLADGTRSQLFDYCCVGVYQKYCTCTKDHKIPESWLFALFGVEQPKAMVPRVSVVFEEAADIRSRDRELKLVQAAIEEAGVELEKLTELALKGFFGVDEAIRRKEAIEGKKAAALGRQAELLSTPEGARVFDEAPAALSRLGEVLADESIPVRERRVTLQRLVDRIVVDRPHIRVLLRPEALESEDLPRSA